MKKTFLLALGEDNNDVFRKWRIDLKEKNNKKPIL